jgi:ABC-type nitrate/sulfonate/bicarbonate transport system substrate-binding protein
VIYWIAKEAGIFKKHGLDLDTIFINGSVRGIQSLIAGDLSYSGAVGTAVINANLAGGDVAIIQSQMNTLPYFIIGNANIKSPEGLKGPGGGGPHSRHLGRFRDEAGVNESRHSLQRR